jgi:hypothetical protein
VHSPPCPTWRIHHRRHAAETSGKFDSLDAALADALDSWRDELLMGDPEFYEELDRMLAETRAAMDAVA